MKNEEIKTVWALFKKYHPLDIPKLIINGVSIVSFGVMIGGLVWWLNSAKIETNPTLPVSAVKSTPVEETYIDLTEAAIIYYLLGDE